MSTPGPGDDDATLRAHLHAELERLGQSDPRACLGLSSASGQAEARAAFRELAKRYHPTLFARRNRDIYRLANEVFLKLRQAHEALMEGSSRAMRASPEPRAAAGRAAEAAAPARGPSAGSRAESSPPAGARGKAEALRAERAARLAQQLGHRRGNSGADASAGPASRPAAPAEAAKPGRQRPPSAAAEDATANARTAPSGAGASSARASSTRASSARANSIDGLLADARAEEARADEAFRAALAHLDCREPGRASEARQTLQKLAASYPQKRTYRAHFHCALALERAAAGRIGDARSELERALALEPDLARARELKRELATGPRGLLSRLRKR